MIYHFKSLVWVRKGRAFYTTLYQEVFLAIQGGGGSLRKLIAFTIYSWPDSIYSWPDSIYLWPDSLYSWPDSFYPCALSVASVITFVAEETNDSYLPKWVFSIDDLCGFFCALALKECWRWKINPMKLEERSILSYFLEHTSVLTVCKGPKSTISP